MAKTTVELPTQLHMKLRLKAAVENRSMNDIVLAALDGYVHDFRLSPDLLEPDSRTRREYEIEERPIRDNDTQ